MMFGRLYLSFELEFQVLFFPFGFLVMLPEDHVLGDDGCDYFAGP